MNYTLDDLLDFMLQQRLDAHGKTLTIDGVDTLVVSDPSDHVTVLHEGVTAVVLRGGTVKRNYGTVQRNRGTVEWNDGTVRSNGGTVEWNGGTVKWNGGTVQVNDGTVQWNDGTVEHAAGGVVTLTSKNASVLAISGDAVVIDRAYPELGIYTAEGER